MLNSLAGPRPDYNSEKKNDDDFNIDFHDVNKFSEADQIQLLTADASAVNLFNQPFSLNYHYQTH